MTLFFNGQEYITPTTVSAVEDSAMADSAPAIGNNVVLIGHCTMGRPKTPLTFQDPTSAKAALGTGDLATAAAKAFSPFPGGIAGPNQVTVLRVDPALPSTLTLKDAANNNVIVLTSSDFGLYTAGIKAKVETGTTSGKRLTTALGTSSYAGDNVGRRAFQIQYSGGGATAVMAINGTTVTLSEPTGTVVATIDLNVHNTIQSLVDAIGAVAGFTATVLDNNGALATLQSLDFVTAQDVKTAPYVARADLQAAVDFYNSTGEGLVDAVRATGAGAPPANLAFTYLAGGTDGTATNNDWSDCFSVLQTLNAQRISALSPDPSIAAMTAAHVAYMSVQGKKERRGYAGGDIGDAIADATTDAGALNSDRMCQCYPGYWDFDNNGVLTLYGSYMTAGIVAAGMAAISPGTALTNTALNVRGLEYALRNPTDTDVLISGGVLCLEDVDDGPDQGFKVVKSCTTWLQNANFNRVEDSTGAAVDYATQAIRQGLDVYRGKGASPTLLGQILNATTTLCDGLSVAAPNGPGIFVGDAESPPYKNILVTVVGDRISVTLQASPVIPANYITITLFIVPYSGSVSSASSQ